MAIKKLTNIFDDQADGSYWKITYVSLTIKKDVRYATFFLSLFKNKAKSETDAPSLSILNFTFEMTNQEANGDLRKFGYQKIRAEIDQFKDAEDEI